MSFTYKYQTWFNDLPKDEIALCEALQEAQKKQGNSEELEPTKRYVKQALDKMPQAREEGILMKKFLLENNFVKEENLALL